MGVMMANAQTQSVPTSPTLFTLDSKWAGGSTLHWAESALRRPSFGLHALGAAAGSARG
jgi:hypothetical protein